MIVDGAIKGQPGRVLAKGEVVAELDVPLISAICAHRHRWRVAGREIGRPCSHCGHALRRAKAAGAGQPTIVVAFVPPDPCPCGTASPTPGGSA